jgi:hypothetical protein
MRVVLRIVQGFNITKFEISNPQSKNLQPATRTPQLATRDPQPATRTPQLATRDPQPVLRHPQPARRFDKTGRISYKIFICALKGNVNVK